MSEVDQDIPIIEEIELTPLDVKGELVTVDDEDAGEPAARPFLARHGLFILTVIIPLALSALYFFVVAAPRYISEAHFIVRSSSTAMQGGGGLTAMIENQGLSRANDETYAVVDYLVSRDIVNLLTRNDALREILARPEADFINRYPNFFTRDNAENLYLRYKSMVSAKIDASIGISIVRVDAFRSEDAHSVAAAILKYAEAMINRLNERAYADAELYAQSIVDREQDHIGDIEKKFTAYRNTSATVDPSKEALAGFELIGKMTTEIVLLQAQLNQQSAMAPSDPNIPAMRQRILAYQSEIDKQKRAIVGGDKSLATKLDGFERLELERELAARALGMAMVSLAKAREDANQQHLYLQTIVEPNFADERDYSRGLFGMLIVLLVSLAVFTIARAVGSIVLEHAA